VAVLRRIANLFRRNRVDGEIDAELQAHLALRIDDNIARGMSPAEARRDALVRFGNVTSTRENAAQADVALNLETIWADVRYAFRQLRRSPGFAFTAVATLALAIGANAVTFSVLNAFVLRPLNVPHAESLVGVWRMPADTMAQSYPDYVDLRDRNHSFDGLLAYNVNEVGFDTGNNPSRAWALETSGNYFDALMLQPFLGRVFHASDERGPNSAPYIVLTHTFWQNHFQSDPGVIGRQVRLNKHPFTIIGVAPPEFHGTLLFFNPDFFIPLVDRPLFSDNALTNRGDRWVFMSLGHLKSDVTQAQAIADLNAIGADLAKNYPKDDGATTYKLVSPNLYGDYVGKPVREFMTGLMVLSGLILLAACANLGSLFAARASDRSREVALRLALGSSRQRILRGLLTEALLISLAGGAVGLACSVVALHGLSIWHPVSRWPLYLNVAPDAKVYVVAVLLALVSGLLFGAVPVRQVLRTNPYEVVKTGANNRQGRWITIREVLLVIQIAICGVLVTASLVAVRGLVRSLDDDFGFQMRDQMLVNTDLSMASYTGDRVAPIQKRMLDAVATIPGVESVGLTDELPLSEGVNDANVFKDNTPDLKPANVAADVGIYKVSPEYLHAAGTALLAGRNFTWSDDKSAIPVAIVNPEFARRIFGSVENALGNHYKLSDGTRIQVVGVAEQGKYNSLTEDPFPAMFLPILQSPSNATWLVVRSKLDPLQLGPAIRSTIHTLDGGLPVLIQTRPMAMDAILFGPHMATVSLGILGAMGAILSITGIFGIAAYSVSKRRRELGIRVALGAQRTEVLTAALGRAVKLLAVGSIAGLLLGILASRVLAYVVYQATPRDPIVLACVVLAMVAVGVLATWIPAQRALTVDPMILLRED
jgi:predicted permease